MAQIAPYYGITVTLSDTDAHNLYDLLYAIDSSLLNLYAFVKYVRIQASSTNAANAVYIGDANVASTRMAYDLLIHDQVPYESPAGHAIAIKKIYVRASAATCKLNVELIP